MSAAAGSTQKVLFLDHVGVLGGAELVLVDLAGHLGKNGHVLLLADGPLKTALEKAGSSVTILATSSAVTTVRRSSGVIRAFRTIPHVIKLARSIARTAKSYDVVWANSQKSFVIGCFAAALAGRPLVWHMHDILTADHFSSSNRRIAIALANRFATRVVTVSQAGRRSFIDAGGNVDLVTVVYNGIDPAGFAMPTDTDRKSLRDSLGVGNAPTVGLFGRLTNWKGQHVLIDALKSLPGVHALLVGEALFNEDVYADSLRKLAADSGVADRCQLTGFRTDIAPLMNACDVIAHTSTAPEPFGRVIVEGMLAGRPVVATAAGGAAEIVTDSVDGLLVPPGDSEKLADAIRRLLDDPALAAKLTAQARKTAVEKFGLDTFLSGCDRVAREVAFPRLNQAITSGGARAEVTS
jgi:glycosyltransferase involved in cell wall biosynthesis